MANPAWPNTLPQYVFKEGYSEKPGDNTIETPVDAGPAKSRRRYTAKVRRFTVTLRLDPTQRTTFETFHRDTLAEGSLPFDWVHPLSRATATFVFRKPHWAINAVVGTSVMVQLTLEQTA